MSKTLQAKQNYALRREMRLRRDKTAALLMPWFLGDALSAGLDGDRRVQVAAERATRAADTLLEQLDSTRKDLAPNGQTEQ